MAAKPSSMKSLVAYEKIRDIILTGEKLPGTRLVISELESELGIGKGPIREALMRLDRSGLVKNVPYKGAMVAKPPSRKEIVIIFNLRIELEVQLAVEAMHNITAEQIADLEGLHRMMVKEEGDFYALDRKFHSVINEASKLPHLFAIVGKLIEAVETFLTLYSQEVSDRQKFTMEHKRILEAIKAKDENELKEAMATNINSGLNVVERTLSRLMR